MNSKYSLKSKREFNLILNKGFKKRTNYLMVSSMKSEDFKIGFSVPKKLGNAVFRNRNKRILKAIIPTLELYSNNKHIVVIVKRDFIDLSFEKKKEILKRDIEKVIK